MIQSARAVLNMKKENLKEEYPAEEIVKTEDGVKVVKTETTEVLYSKDVIEFNIQTLEESLVFWQKLKDNL